MNSTKLIALGGIMAGLAVLFQSAPVLFTEIFAIMTMFSALPIYIISRTNPKTGLCAYFAASLVIFIISTHEGILFLCTNGLIGLCLGAAYTFSHNKSLTIAVATLLLCASMSFITYVIGIPVLGFRLSAGICFELAIFLAFSLVYSTIFLCAAEVFYRLFAKRFIN